MMKETYFPAFSFTIVTMPEEASTTAEHVAFYSCCKETACVKVLQVRCSKGQNVLLTKNERT